LRPRRTIAIVSPHSKRAGARAALAGLEAVMVQTTNRFFDEVARLMNDAAGVAQGVRREFETLFRTQAERWLRDLDLVKREEFEAVKDMARIAREENEALKTRLTALEASVAKIGAEAASPSAGTAASASGAPSEPPFTAPQAGEPFPPQAPEGQIGPG
jgi:BMFP domain-containing protein YqiC